jgi:hypothetical protein
MNPVLIMIPPNSKIIPELNQEAEQRVKTDDSKRVP